MAFQPLYELGTGFNPMVGSNFSSDASGMYETEEERRRRLYQEAVARGEIPAGPVAPTEPTPIKQTITIDPRTGEQKMKLEGSVQDLSAANPMTPTVSMPQAQVPVPNQAIPVAGPMAPGSGPSPEELLREQEQRRQYELMMAQPPAAPVAPAQPPVQMAAATPPTRTDVTAPTTNPVSPAAEPLGTGIGRPQMAPETGAMNYSNILVAASRDPAAMERIARDPSTPEPVRQAAASQAKTILEDQKKMDQAEGEAKNIIQRGGRFPKPTEEGSHVLAWLYKQAGLDDLSRAEQAKLITTWQQVTDDKGNPALVQFRGNVPVQGYDKEFNPIPDNQLISYAGGIGKFKPEIGGAYVKKDAQGNVIARGIRTTQVTAQNRTISKIESGGKTYDFDSTWEPETVSTAVSKQQQMLPGRYTESYVTGAGTAQGRAAGEGLQVGPAPPPPGVSGMPSPAPVAPAAVGAPTAPAAVGAPTVIGSTSSIPAPTAGISVPAQRAGIERGQKRGESFDKIVDTEYREDARKGDVVSSNRKDQFAILERRDPATGRGVGEQIAGLYNAASQDPGNQKLTIIRDIMLGKVGLPEDEVSQRVAQLNISEAAKSALREYNAMNAKIAAQSLRETAGPGSVSDAEQAANRAANVDITKTPLLGVYQMMARSQFGADIQRYKADLAANSTDRYSNATQFDRDFRKIQSQLTNTYREIATKRNEFIQRNGNTPEAIREGYQRYPVPQYDPNINNGQGGWRYLKPIGEILQ